MSRASTPVPGTVHAQLTTARRVAFTAQSAVLGLSD
ncbi:hypothetical protein GGR63_000724 [Xanthomonas sp. 3272]|nr:hypothetical protein [Xanthomonas arboricola]